MSEANISSCMYQYNSNFENGCQTDYFQLGWLVSWVIEQGSDYHGREWEKQSPRIRGNKFIRNVDKNKCTYRKGGIQPIITVFTK